LKGRISDLSRETTQADRGGQLPLTKGKKAKEEAGQSADQGEEFITNFPRAKPWGGGCPRAPVSRESKKKNRPPQKKRDGEGKNPKKKKDHRDRTPGFEEGRKMKPGSGIEGESRGRFEIGTLTPSRQSLDELPFKLEKGVNADPRGRPKEGGSLVG